MRELPSGTVTFLFTDIEGSTRLVQQLGAEGYDRLLGEHSTLLRDAVRNAGGEEFGNEGDAHFFVFPDAEGALRAAAAAQVALGGHPWPTDAEIRVRVGIHTGNPTRRGDGYVGVDLNRVARIAAAGHGGQVLVSDDTRRAAERALDGDLQLVDLGRHRLKDLVEPERIFQLAGPDLRADFPAIRTIDTRPKHLPAQLTSFVGRAEELAAVTDLVAGSRLVTLTGPGGSGKTRLAVAAADRLLPRFDDGVFFVPLAPLQEPERVPSAVAVALGLREAPDRPALDVVRDHLVDKRLLLVADNFEHLVPATPVVGDLLEAAPGLSVLATSRVLLRVYGEQEYSVPPLAVPEARIGSEAIAANPCVKLFAERASAVRPDFRLTDQNLPIVAEICRRVDGLPLAVELAAARIRILSPAELLGRLVSRLSTLTGGARDLPERQRTLRATIDWSHELLEPEERRLFARLSAFAGGWSREAAEAICASDLSIDVLDGLESLLDKSLVRREVMPDDQLRFDMLETIREYAKERLEEHGDAVRVRRLHASYYRKLAEAAEPDLTGPESGRWIEILTRETPNLRMALQWALDSGETSDLEEALVTAGALWRYWQLTGSLREAAEWLDRLLAHPASAAPTAARAKALRGDGGIEYWRNDMAKSRQLYEQSVAIYRGLDDQSGLASALNDLAYLPMLAGELELARSMFGEARQLFEAAGDQWQAALAQFNLASLSFFTGDYAEARRLMDAALPVFRARGERFWLIEAVTGLGQLDQLEGNIEGARRNFAESLQLALDSAMLPSIAMVLDPLSNLESEAGDHERAVKLWAASQAIKEKVGGGAPSEMMQAVDPSPAAIEALGAEAVSEAWRAGQSMSPEEAVAYAVGASQPEKRAVTASRS